MIAPDSQSGLALIAAHRSAIEALCGRYRVRQLALVGSALRGDADAARGDIDLTVEFEETKEASPAHQYFDFKSELERLLGRQADLVELRAMQDCRLKRIIQKTQVPVHGRAA